MLTIRALDPSDPAELEWVAQGMRATLIEVEGEAVGSAIHSLDWLRERVRWHLHHPCAAVWLARQGEHIVGHSIVRAEAPGPAETLSPGRWGLVTTTYVAPDARRHGVAQRLLAHDEAWMRAQGLDHVRTWTATGNRPLIALYERHGYAIVQRADHEGTGSPMVCLARRLDAVSS